MIYQLLQKYRKAHVGGKKKKNNLKSCIMSRMQQKYQLWGNSWSNKSKQKFKEYVNLRREIISSGRRGSLKPMQKSSRELGWKTITVNISPLVQEAEALICSNIQECEKHRFINNSEWLRRQAALYEGLKSQTWGAISAKETMSAISKSSDNKSPKKDQVPNFWLKILTSIHQDLADACTNVIEHPEEMPTGLTEGISFLLPKLIRNRRSKEVQACYQCSNHEQNFHIYYHRANL